MEYTGNNLEVPEKAQLTVIGSHSPHVRPCPEKLLLSEKCSQVSSILGAKLIKEGMEFR